MSELKRAAQYVQDELLRDGFTVHRYDAHGTNSIYLKVDCGVCHSIRISDHRGYPHLKYRYNLNSECDRYKCNSNKFTRHYFPLSEDGIAHMLRLIREEREEMLARYGEGHYRNIVEASRRRGQAKRKGFWSQCREVEEMIGE